jgi:hypothetical protein
VRLLRKSGFEVVSVQGSVLVAGPFSNLLLTGLAAPMALNRFLGERLTPVAAGFFIACRRGS